MLDEHPFYREKSSKGGIPMLISAGLVSTFVSTVVPAAISTVLWIEPDWSERARIIPGESRRNIYQLKPTEFSEITREGRLHALNYPVSETGVLIPYDRFKSVFEDSANPLREILRRIMKITLKWNSSDDFYAWLGLSPYPKENSEFFPFKNDKRPKDFLGVTIVDSPKGRGMTFSCAACHSGMLFGRPVLGLPAKRSRANDLFHKAKVALPQLSPQLYRVLSGAPDTETEMYARTRRNLRAVGAIVPQSLGLDTSLAQVALGLAHRNTDPYATKSHEFEIFPRANPLTNFVADSKPGTWWVLKYKTRWLSDGSIISGNPIYTNFLWNEIGRGTDLRELESWMRNNEKVIHELTAAVFNTPAPHWTDFFDPKTVDVEKAKVGEVIFNNRCSRCHGTYIKGWSTDTKDSIQMLKTIRVYYHEKTPVINVGTDPQRAQGMKYFYEALNNLEISKKMGTIVELQSGYVPPPLEGIFARFPYFHNASVPNLCALLGPASERPSVFAQGEPLVPGKDYDLSCIGYPTGDKTPEAWWSDFDSIYDATKPGLSNLGHEFEFTQAQKMSLIEFLKTL